MNFPISIISHNSVIPANTPNFVEKFEKIEFPNRDDFDLRITSITVKCDTTALYNITQDNNVKIVASGHESIITLKPGYYSKEALSTALNGYLNFDENGKAYVSNNAERVDAMLAPDLIKIINIGKHYIDANETPEKAADISRGRNVIKIYSSINEQPYSNESTTLIDTFIYKQMGLNNCITYDNLNIAVREMSTIDQIQWSLKDRNDEPLSIAAPVIVNFIISVLPK